MRILVTGATGVIGTETVDTLRAADAPPHVLVRTARRATDAGLVPWPIGRRPVPAELGGHWDVIVHTAASTRWTMTRSEALAANVEPLRAVLALAGRDTHLVHVSTAYVAREPEERRERTAGGAEFEGYRNGYEWSKALCEEVVRQEHPGPLTIVRPPLVVGRRGDGRIARFSGPYTLLHALVSGLAAVVVGDPDGFAEISPVDEVAAAIADAALGSPPGRVRTETVAAGPASLRLATLIDVTCTALNTFRAAHGAPPVARPPIISPDAWTRFFLPLADRWLSPFQSEAVKLLAMFQGYTSMAVPFVPTRPVRDPADAMTAAVRHWAVRRPRLALAEPRPWTLLTTPGGAAGKAP
ncbi:SDR family oxidoreductase [Streptomyces sp. NPDC048106]|uniref:SDR family oxidoreductase n=1 Tax=Streptomyces sp. NPDC048106 TaxID=3155750 RepID=UPI0034572D8F